jgi:hypothetical protein
METGFQVAQAELARQKLPEDKFEHSVRVGLLASRQGARYATVGLMHDMFEDSSVTEEQLRGAGVSDEELTAVRLLTRGRESYEDYVAAIVGSGNRLAISVKVCDLLDHLDPSLSEGLDEAKQTKYLNALPSLLDALRDAPR